MRGSGNAFRDLGCADPDEEQAKAILAAEIIKALDSARLTVEAARVRTGIAAADLLQIRQANLERFTAEQLDSLLKRLGSGEKS